MTSTAAARSRCAGRTSQAPSRSPSEVCRITSRAGPAGHRLEAPLDLLVEARRTGRLSELDVSAVSQVDAMCQKLLVNPLIEDYEIVS